MSIYTQQEGEISRDDFIDASIDLHGDSGPGALGVSVVESMRPLYTADGVRSNGSPRADIFVTGGSDEIPDFDYINGRVDAQTAAIHVRDKLINDKPFNPPFNVAIGPPPESYKSAGGLRARRVFQVRPAEVTEGSLGEFLDSGISSANYQGSMSRTLQVIETLAGKEIPDKVAAPDSTAHDFDLLLDAVSSRFSAEDSTAIVSSIQKRVGRGVIAELATGSRPPRMAVYGHLAMNGLGDFDIENIGRSSVERLAASYPMGSAVRQVIEELYF